jgi:mono/diheme cytochrome c family protein
VTTTLWLCLVLSASELRGEPANGKALYKKLCASCHGDKGLGNGPAAVALNPKPSSFVEPTTAARLSPEWVYGIVKDGGLAKGKSKLMVAMAGVLTEQQLRDVSAYVLALAAR